MILNFIEEAEFDLVEAAEWYESEEPGLGVRFRDEVEYVTRQIAEDPLIWREREGGYRRVNCPVFPYYIPYIIRGDTIILLAVAHGHRDPNYWKSRMNL